MAPQREANGSSRARDAAGNGDGDGDGTENGDGAGSRGGSGADAGDGGEEPPLPPGPDSLPLIGNGLQLMRDPFGFLDRLAGYDDVARYRVFGRWFTALQHPDHVERVLVEEPEHFDRFLFGDRGLDFAPEGLLFADDEQWRRQRAVMRPAFTMDRIRSYADTMADYADRTADEWADGETVVLNDEFSRLALRILSKSLFDVETDPRDGDAAVAEAARVINRRGDARRLSAFLPGWLPTPANRRYERAMDRYRERVDELMAERRREAAAAEAGEARDGGDDAEDGPATERDDLLSILLFAEGPDGEGLSEAEVRDNLITFLFAGHETTSLGLTYAVLALSRHPDVADRMRAELDEVLDGERPRFEHVPRLEYTERVLREALRRYPPAYIQFREATEDVEIGGYRIPEGTVLSLPQIQIHRDERFYDDPAAFRPDRWTEAGESDRPEYAYFPFGGGPRHCVGMRFAMLEMRLVLATVCQRFEFELLSDPEPTPTAGATLRPREDVRVRVHRR